MADKPADKATHILDSRFRGNDGMYGRRLSFPTWSGIQCFLSLPAAA